MKRFERVIRIFVGEGDYPSQKPLADKRRKQGWAMGKSTESDDIRASMEKANGALVVIHGADASECVPILAAEALARGATRVVIPLDKVRTSFEGHDPLMTRAHEMAERLDVQTALQDPQLTVTPTRVWKKAKHQRGLGVVNNFFREHHSVE